MRWEASSLRNNFYTAELTVSRSQVSPNLMTSGRLKTRRDWSSSRRRRWRAVILLTLPSSVAHLGLYFTFFSLPASASSSFSSLEITRPASHYLCPRDLPSSGNKSLEIFQLNSYYLDHWRPSGGLDWDVSCRNNKQRWNGREREGEGGREREGERGRVKVRKYFVIDTKPQLSKLLC